MSAAPHPILAVALAEWRRVHRRPATWLLVALFAALLAAAGWLNHHRQVRDRAQQSAWQQLVRAQWEGQPDRHPHRAAHYGTFAFRPPGPLASFDPGLDAYSGRTLYLEAHRQNATNFSEAGELSSAFRLGVLSPAFVLQLVLPLVVIVLGHRIWVEDRESGRLGLLLSQGVAPRHLALGKLLGLGAALTPFALAALLAAAGVLLPDPAFLGGVAPWSRLGLLGAALLLHTFAWLGLCVWVSGRTATAAHACSVLVSLWIVGGIVLPRTAAAFAAARHPLPDKTGFAAAVSEEVRRQGDAHDPNDPNFAQFRRDTLARYGVDRVEDLPINYGGMLMAHGEELSAKAFARHFAALAERMHTQVALVDEAGWAAPYLALRRVSAALAGTDLRAQLRFQQEAEAYRFGFIQRLNELHRDEIRFENDREQRVSAHHWNEIPDFRPAPVPLRESLAGTGTAWLALLAWAAVPFLALLRTAPRSP